MLDKYHHGDLRNALIEEGIKMINTQGEEGLSLRKLATVCGVSNAAPYAHFASKEDMINAMKEYVSQKFYDFLKVAVDEHKDESVEKRIVAMGNAYVLFFMHNPEYFTFLFSRGYIHLNLDLQSDDEVNFKPYEMLKNLCLEYFTEVKPDITDYEKELEIIRIWSSVQGLTSITFMENVRWSKNWEEQISIILK